MKYKEHTNSQKTGQGGKTLIEGRNYSVERQ